MAEENASERCNCFAAVILNSIHFGIKWSLVITCLKKAMNCGAEPYASVSLSHHRPLEETQHVREDLNELHG